jgi:DNA-binding NarL/FixJ family response regulator
MQVRGADQRSSSMTASAAPRSLPSWTPTMVAVVGAKAQLRTQATALLRAAGFGIWATAADGSLAADALEPGTVVVLLHSGTAIERVRATQALADAHPGAHVVVAMPDDAANAPMRRALRAGAAGIVLESELERALAPTARAVAAGQLAVPSSLRSQIAPRALSHREKQILALVVLGLTNRQIADELFLAESTVKTHLSSAFGKLDAHSRADATARILDPESGYGVGILSLGNGAPTPAS